MVRNKLVQVTTKVMVIAIVLSIMLLFIGIGVLIIIHICLVGRAFRRGFGNGIALVDQRSSNSSSNNNINIIINGRSFNVCDIEKLPCFDYKAKNPNNSSSSLSNSVDCVVCLENFKVGDKCRLLPTCNHSFHAFCVDAWLLKNPTCPLCRTGVGVLSGMLDRLSDAAVEVE